MPRVKSFNEIEVLEKAINLFWKKGFYATSIQDLVNHLGINRASLYDTYGGKSQLFKTAFIHYRKSNTDKIKEILGTEKDVKKGFKNLFHLALQQSASDLECKGCMVVNTTVEFIPNEGDFVDLISENKQVFEQIFHEYLLTGVESGQISEENNLPAIATLFFTFYNGLKVVTKVDFDADVFSKSVDTLLSTLD